jgi:porin
LHLPVFRSCVLSHAALFAVAPMCAQQETLYHQQHTAGPLSKWIEGDRGLSDLGGIRNILSDHGLEFFGGYTAEVWGNTTGGIKRGTVYTGLLDFGANLDFEKMVGWQGASFSTTWLWFSGRDASEDLAGNFLTVSNIAGFNTLRMLEMWFQQDFWQRDGDGKPAGLSIRLGQLTADSEFIISDYSSFTQASSPAATTTSSVSRLATQTSPMAPRKQPSTKARATSVTKP